MVDDLRRALIATSLFSSVQIAPVERALGDGTALADLDIGLAPAKPRTIAALIGYDTIDGFRLEGSWRHRNLIPPEGAVTARAVAGTREQSVGGDLIFSNWRKRDQTLALTSTLGHYNTAAFNSYALDLNARIERRTTLIFQKTWTYSYGLEVAASDERDHGLLTGIDQRRQFFLVAAPLQLGYDGSNDVLDATRGFRLNGRVSPEQSLRGDFSYVRLHVDGSIYQPLGSRLVGAARLAFGAISGAPLNAIPPSRRLYVGGGGSVRGYGYQDIGPKDANNNPVGGRSSTELAIEARYRVTKTIGLVPFFDAGSLYTSEYPKFSAFQYGAGLGARYYSAFGPIRFDVATPLNPRRGDSRVAVYVSIGQAF
jgi:translocation and assembly module TamA